MSKLECAVWFRGSPQRTWLDEPDYFEEIIELQSYQDMMFDVASYDDYFPETQH